jgi:hypothetical protein
LLWKEQAAAVNVPSLTGTCPKLHVRKAIASGTVVSGDQAMIEQRAVYGSR